MRNLHANGAYVFDGPNCIAVCDTDNTTQKEYEDNARLFAAAPQLLEALDDLVGKMHSLFAGRDLTGYEADEIAEVIAAEKAIAKAEGKL